MRTDTQRGSWIGIVAVIVLSGLSGAGISWGYAQQGNTGGTLTPQDYIEIQQLYANYAHSNDLGRNGGRIGHTFTPDGVFQNSSPGSRLLKASTVQAGVFRGRRHGCINLLITPTPEGANGSCYLYELDVKDIPARIVISGVYDDTLVKTPQGWRFTKRFESIDGDALSPYNSTVPRRNQP